MRQTNKWQHALKRKSFVWGEWKYLKWKLVIKVGLKWWNNTKWKRIFPSPSTFCVDVCLLPTRISLIHQICCFAYIFFFCGWWWKLLILYKLLLEPYELTYWTIWFDLVVKHKNSYVNDDLLVQFYEANIQLDHTYKKLLLFFLSKILFFIKDRDRVDTSHKYRYVKLDIFVVKSNWFLYSSL